MLRLASQPFVNTRRRVRPRYSSMLHRRTAQLLEVLRHLPRRGTYTAAGLAATVVVLGGLWAIDLLCDDQLVVTAPIYAYVLGVFGALLGGLGYWLGDEIEVLRRQAALDPLTGLPNRRHLKARLTEELERSQRYGEPMSLLVIDIDELKKINDLNGHLMGDAAICWVARCVDGLSRGTDIAGRFGGDEFVLLAPSTSILGAQCLAERLRVAVGSRPICLAKAERRLTISIGVASTSSDRCTLDELFAVADSRLYSAKNAGRDRVSITSAVNYFTPRCEKSRSHPAVKPHRRSEGSPSLASKRGSTTYGPQVSR